MKCARYIAGLTIAALVLSGCSQSGTPAARRVSARLNAGGTYYLVADKTLVAPQIHFMLDRIRPAVAPVIAQSGLPVTFDDIVGAVGGFCDKIGFSRIKATGASSIVLYGSESNLPYFFHNRAVLDTAGAENPPPFLTFFDGEKIWLNDYLKSVPGDALGAGVGYVDFGAIWRWVNESYKLPAQVATTVQMYAQCPPDEFFSGISGKISIMMMPPVEGGLPRILYQIPDRDNRVFKMIAKFRMVDAAREDTVILPLDPQAPISSMIFKRVEDRLLVATGTGVIEHVDEMLAKGETLDKNAAVKRARVRIPDSATAYNIYNYSIYNGLGNECEPVCGGSDFWSISSMSIDAGGAVSHINDYYDWNGMPFNVLLAILPNLANGYKFAQQASEAVPVAVPVAGDSGVASANNLKQIGLGLMMYKADHKDSLPEKPGFAGLKVLADQNYLSDPAVFRNPADAKTTLAGELKALAPNNVSYVYFGALPDVPVAPAKMPLAFERPDLRLNGNLCVLFGDGHVESLTVPVEVDDCEELVSYLHTQKKYSEKELKALSERAHLLDGELGL